jgi:hypothetical protein
LVQCAQEDIAAAIAGSPAHQSREDAGHKLKSIKDKSDIEVDKECGKVQMDGQQILMNDGQMGDSEIERRGGMIGGDETSGVGYDVMGLGVGDGNMGGDDDDDPGMGYGGNKKPICQSLLDSS